MVNGDGKALNVNGKPVKGKEGVLNCIEKALKGDEKNIKVDPKSLKCNEMQFKCNQGEKRRERVTEKGSIAKKSR